MLAREDQNSSNRCACGRRTVECPFWVQVCKNWFNEAQLQSAREYELLVQRVEREQRWRFFLGKAVPDTEEFRRYGELNQKLFQAIAKASEKRVVVDCSKRAARAVALASTTELDLRVIHLIRDVRGVVFSLKKKFKDRNAYGALRSNLIWIRGNWQAELILKRLPEEKRTRIRYEDLMERPIETLAVIEQVVGLKLNQIAERIEQRGLFELGHNIAGNRLRLTDAIHLHHDRQWVENLSAKDLWLCWHLSGRLLRRYGYSRLMAGRTSL
jgi:hypothetical protein